eukprot:14723467-Alexandrium_andersonii.AAC.1
MSASLVGSEMCIRDSAFPVEVDGLMAVADLLSVLQAGRLDVTDSWPAAVSYTHLTLPTICSV